MKYMWIGAFAIATVAAVSARGADQPDGLRWWSHVRVLADDKLEGRDTGSAGHRKAAEYVAGEFQRLGLKPAGTEGYFQPVKFLSKTIDETHSRARAGPRVGRRAARARDGRHRLTSGRSRPSRSTPSSSSPATG